MDFAARVYLSEDPSPPWFLFRVGLAFCRFWIWSDTECKTPAEYGPQHNPDTTPLPLIHCIRTNTGKGGRGSDSETRGEGQKSTGEYRTQSWFENTNMTERMEEICYISSL
jgi:hypothetical protein